MNFFQELQNSLVNTFKSMAKTGAESIPRVLVFLLIILIGFLIAKLLRKLLVKSLEKLNFDQLIEKVNLDKILNKIKPGLSITKVLGNILYWLVNLAFITAAANYMGLLMVSVAIAVFFAYIPTLLVAIIILIIGLYICDIVKNIIYTAANSIGISGAKAIANVVYYLLAVMVVITALEQAGVDTSMIRTNIHLIIGAFLFAFAISYGFASRELVTNILSSYYGKGKFKEGMKVRINGEEGIIEKVDSISVTLVKESDERIVLPSRTLIEDKIEILTNK
ncbi:MAG: hypothetical protein AB8B53_07295 [Flavobacteriales bacterium]